MFRTLLVTCSVLVSMIALAEDRPKGVEEFKDFDDKPLEGWVWDEDQRLLDLVVQLQEKELILQEIDAKLAKATGKRASSKMTENMAWRSTQRMDLNGGGPIRWDAFYGRNAEKFFYHPTDPNTTYHTNTALRQVDPSTAGGVAGNQGVPAHQRPPQFDYIYRGYETAQARAREEAKNLADRIEDMKSRRRELENEVVVLWMKLAFRVIDRDKLPENPTLRFAFKPKAAGNDEANQQAAALTAATQFLATAMLFNEALAEASPDNAFGGVSEVVKENRKVFEDSFLKLKALRKEANEKGRPVGQFKFLSRELEDAAKMLSEGYEGWKDGDANEEESVKFAGLKRVQDGVVRYSQILLALNELVGRMENEWAVDLNTDSTEFRPRWDVTHVPPTRSPTRSITPQSADLKLVSLLQGVNVAAGRSHDCWTMVGPCLHCTGKGVETFTSFTLESPLFDRLIAKGEYDLALKITIGVPKEKFGTDVMIGCPGVPGNSRLWLRHYWKQEKSKIMLWGDRQTQVNGQPKPSVEVLSPVQFDKAKSFIVKIKVREAGRSVAVLLNGQPVINCKDFPDFPAAEVFRIYASLDTKLTICDVTVADPNL
jgi:hypothetical protein